MNKNEQKGEKRKKYNSIGFYDVYLFFVLNFKINQDEKFLITHTFFILMNAVRHLLIKLIKTFQSQSCNKHRFINQSGCQISRAVVLAPDLSLTCHERRPLASLRLLTSITEGPSPCFTCPKLWSTLRKSLPGVALVITTDHNDTLRVSAQSNYH